MAVFVGLKGSVIINENVFFSKRQVRSQEPMPNGLHEFN